ncbi:MAG: tetratricopeptide repeat protein [Polyangiaceae bacterium]
MRGELYRDLGVVLLGLGKKKQALSTFERALQVDPDGRLESRACQSTA